MAKPSTLAPWLADLADNKLIRVLANKRDRRVLFALAHEGYIRNFRDVIVDLVSRGVHVLIVVSKQHSSIAIEDYDFLRGPNCTVDVIALRKNFKGVSPSTERLRVLRDILHMAGDAFKDASDLHARFAGLQDRSISEAKIERLRALVAAMAPERRNKWRERLDAREARAVPRVDVDRVMKRFSPHLVVVSPYVQHNSQEVDAVKAARGRGMSTLLAVASWDNLTNKGVMKVQPDAVAVWNVDMAREAVDLHGTPPERIAITGAPVFDRWFERAPHRSRAEFCRALGFDPARKTILYLCSSHSITGGAERAVFARVLDAIRTSTGTVKRANVLVRPHPMATNVWDKFDIEEGTEGASFKSARVWPVAPKHPTDDATENEYFETLYHADAIIALNTSAMLEAAILNKPVFTFLDHEARQHQTGNLHFAHLIHTKFVNETETLDEMMQLLEKFFSKSHDRSFVANGDTLGEFVRPITRKRSASSVLADLIMHHADIQAAGVSSMKPSWLAYTLTQASTPKTV